MHVPGIRENEFEEYLLTLFLGILYSLFLISAFYRINNLWGINYIYYLPVAAKISLLTAGGIIFIPSVNRLMRISIQKSAEYILSYMERNTWLRLIIYATGILALFFCFFEFFRVFPLYHDNTQAVFYMNQNLPIYEYYAKRTFLHNKHLLLFFFAFNRFILHDTIGLSPYYSLAISSSFIGVLFFIFVIKLIKLFKLNRSGSILIFALLFTQAINYYYFGYTNYYTIVPFLLFMYIYASARYFVQHKSVAPALIWAALILSAHLGAVFILPSSLFLIVHHFKARLPGIYRLAILSNAKVTVVSLVSAVIGVYLLISLNILNIGPVSDYLIKAFVPLFSDSRDPNSIGLFSISQLLHFLNVLLVISPVGSTLFIILVWRHKKVLQFGEFTYFLLWFCVGALAHILFIKPQGLFAWDIYGWVSVGFVLLGGIVYLGSINRRKNSPYFGSLIVCHLFIYFIAWIMLHTMGYPAIANYLDGFRKDGSRDQVSSIIRSIHEQPLESIKYADRILEELERRASTFLDFLYLSDCHYYLKNSAAHERLLRKSGNIFAENEKHNLNSAEDYYRMLWITPDDILKSKEKRTEIESYFKKMISLKPGNPQYLIFYSNYLDTHSDALQSIDVMKKVDSLYSDNTVSLFLKTLNQYEIKMNLMKKYFKIGNYGKAIEYYMVVDSLVPESFIYDETNTSVILLSYAYTGNDPMIESLLANPRFKVNDDEFVKSLRDISSRNQK